MTNALVFLDTETTGLHHDRRPWEIALIRREPNGDTAELRVFVTDVDLSSAELMGLNVGHFYDNHPSFRTDSPMGIPWGDEEFQTSPGVWLATEAKAAVLVERITRGATIVGNNPTFDVEVLAAMLRRHKLCPAWHYHPIDVVSQALGFLSVLNLKVLGDLLAPELVEDLTPPLKSDKLSKLCGITPPEGDERHTAIGDARWVQRWYDRLSKPFEDADTTESEQPQ
ncbi:exonuclease RNase T and DNA polymerase III [Rhodococcus sp. B7740]|nr:exonuclease RNase T and DNA polymerase III [Rhodococcus sp. B7740]